MTRFATRQDVGTIVRMREDASHWLVDKLGVRQWERPWPDEETQFLRIREAVDEGATWIFSRHGRIAATVTAYERDKGGFWEPSLKELGLEDMSALYIHRLIVARDFHGLGVGREVLRWAARRARRLRLRALRIDVWGDNPGLRAYYEARRFTTLGRIPERVQRDQHIYPYPSDVLMQFQLPHRRLNKP
ncbi:GNAT family N-acetyltransferase [Nonomuraea sp. NBC_01738]|uniref:GNAT family N-acetyltransferase n=1 Tax=Nonomuraea sp. NBC_01738 TaxID=2976003 RepID=UPI002E0FC6C3|nr:GNAT family N-acetyltransferase [Nonomuraea sp. NBC_01738]